jgi:predicted lysophospholipase L1 biosynthesis ABC-type transport system permease subunit
VPGLWLEFWRDTSYLLLPLGVVSLGLLLRRPRAGNGLSDRVTGWRGFAGLWTIWTIVATIAFSLIDWKQTKHLTTLLVPVTLATGAVVGAGRLSPRVVIGLALAIIALNLLTITSLAQDFRALVKVPEW